MLDDEGRPRVTLAHAGGRLYSAVDHKPKRVHGDRLARVRFLRRRPHAALTVDHYDDDWRRLRWVQVLGRVAIVEAPGARPQALAALVAKSPAYRDRPPAVPLLELTPERFRGAQRVEPDR
jgi:PPOX class probable F420-dependent enzyme